VTGEGEPLSSVPQLGTEMHGSDGIALTPEEFKSAIRTKLAYRTQ